MRRPAVVGGTLAVPTRRRHQRRSTAGPRGVAVVAAAGVLAILAITLGWRGSDLPAQIFRADLFRQDGFVLWNSQWFGGHALLGYSVIAPAISAPIGPLALGAVSGIASAFLFERILRFSFGSVAWLGSLWFALGTVINLIVGRTTYAFGVALALGAIYALQHRKVGHRRRPRGVVLARESARRLLPRDRRGGVGRFESSPTHGRAARCVAAALVPIAAITLALPDRGFGTVRTVGTDLGSRPVPRSSRSRCAAIPRPVGAPRASRSSPSARSSYRRRWAATSAGSTSTSPGRCLRARCSPAGACSSRCSRSRC